MHDQHRLNLNTELTNFDQNGVVCVSVGCRFPLRPFLCYQPVKYPFTYPTPCINQTWSSVSGCPCSLLPSHFHPLLPAPLHFSILAPLPFLAAPFYFFFVPCTFLFFPNGLIVPTHAPYKDDRKTIHPAAYWCRFVKIGLFRYLDLLLICPQPRKPWRLTFLHRNRVQRTGFEFVSTGIELVFTGSEFISTEICEPNLIPVRKSEPLWLPYSTAFLLTKVMLPAPWLQCSCSLLPWLFWP